MVYNFEYLGKLAFLTIPPVKFVSCIAETYSDESPA